MNRYCNTHGHSYRYHFSASNQILAQSQCFNIRRVHLLQMYRLINSFCLSYLAGLSWHGPSPLPILGGGKTASLSIYISHICSLTFRGSFSITKYFSTILAFACSRGENGILLWSGGGGCRTVVSQSSLAALLCTVNSSAEL
jgi:hypothetical protein